MQGVILISGNGSNLQAIIDNSNNIGLDISCVISDNANAYGLIRAKQANIKTCAIECANKTEFNNKLNAIINTHNPEIIILAGFMCILSANFVKQHSGKIINIHPSLLPKFKGLNTHQRALNNKETKHGASVHFVSEELDCGAIIAQSSLDILATDSAETLANRVIKLEHKLFPLVIRWFTQKRLKLKNNKAWLDNKQL